MIEAAKKLAEESDIFAAAQLMAVGEVIYS